ncbi:TetR family transcriptional regulator, partial [Streptomyces sp. NPDC101178]
TPLATPPRGASLSAARRWFAPAWRAWGGGGAAAPPPPHDLDIRLTYRFVRDTVWVAASWYRPGGHHSPEEIARQYLSMVLDGIALRT